MDYVTIGRKYNEGKIAFVKCEKDGPLSNIAIKDKCFLLVILTKGKLEFEVAGERVLASRRHFCALTNPKIPCLYPSQRRDTPAFISIRDFLI